MRIGLLITKSEAGGAQSHVLELLDGLRTQHNVILASGEDGWLMEEARVRGISVTVIPDLVNPIRPLRDLRACHQLTQWLGREKPDLLHAHSSKAGLLGRIAASVVGIPSVFTAHGWAFTGGATLTRKLVAVPGEWIAARTGGDIICVSHYDRALACRLRIARDSRLHTVWNGIDDTAERARPGASHVPVITMVARFSAPKDHATLIHAAASLIESPWRLRLVGDGPLLSAVQALASRLGIADRVEFLGARTDVAALLASSHIFVLASRFEGLPISIIEAMRAGLPVVASDVGGVSELVDARSGLLVPACDSRALASALARLQSDTRLRELLGGHGRRRYERDFQAGSMIEKTRMVYDKCLMRIRSEA